MTAALRRLALAGAAGGGAALARRLRQRPGRPPKGAPRVVCVGAGFGGLALARALDGAPVEVVLVDRNNFHLFQPLLYQVATAALEPEEIASAVRGVFQEQANVRFRLAEAAGVDWEGRRLLTDGAPEPFDWLVVAAGARTASYGVPGVEAFAFGLKRLEEAVDLRGHTIRQFEEAAQDPAAIERGALTFVVVGGGATGVEMSVALRELFEHVLADDYPGLDVGRARVLLVEQGETVLSAYDERLRAYTLGQLRQRGVEVRLGTAVERVEGRDGGAEAAVLSGGERVLTRTVLWAAGVRAVGLADRLGVAQTGGGRVEVGPDLRVPGRPRAYAVGDLAAAPGADGRPLPRLAPVAQQQARYVAARIAAEARGGAPPAEPFRYVDRGQMATIGRGAAVAELPGGVRLTGFAAWQAWAWLHLLLLVGFRNRANVWVNWVYNYFTYDRSARLILGGRRAGRGEPRRATGAAGPPAPPLAD
jgi:NADH dehydrogenase